MKRWGSLVTSAVIGLAAGLSLPYLPRYVVIPVVVLGTARLVWMLVVTRREIRKAQVELARVMRALEEQQPRSVD